MNRAEALRDLYEALDLLDASQASGTASGTATGAAARVADPTVTVDLRDADRGLLARNLGRPAPRVALGADWERGTTRW